MATPTHGLHKGADGVLRDGRPLHLEELNQPGQGARWRMVGTDSSSKNVPKVFNWVEIRRARWPGHPDDLMTREEVGYNACPMRRRVVILEDGVWSKVIK